jgi:very-short-patch-repair endonuclease
VFQSDLPIREKLDRARTELLDLSARNRLLNMPRASKSARAIDIVDEKSAEIFRLLVRDGRPFTFVAGKAAATAAEDEDELEEITDLAQPDDDEVDHRGVLARHSDTRLQTRLTPKGLQKRLLELYFDARTLEEEQGVNILYLALGALKWTDPQNRENVRFAPLLLIPVSLERGNAGEKFKLRARPEDFASNLSLEAFLDRVHGLKLPSFEASDSFDPTEYIRAVAEAVAVKTDWAVLEDDVVLGFFSFAKFLMYRDLDPDSWPQGSAIVDRELVRGLLSDGFTGGGELIPEDANIDPHIPPSEMLHIVDSDSSQALAIHEVRKGRNLVIQGPPGTGKSQTIANVIASAVADGKTVLFVAEKMAALEVVKRRLDATGVGDACLELHSNKANKKAVLEELKRTWELGPPKGQDPGTLHARLTTARDSLNGHVARMHFRHQSSGLTPFQVIGQLTRLRLDGQKPTDIALEGAVDWSSDDFEARHNLIADLVARIETIGRPDDHPWLGVRLSSIIPTDAERLIARIEQMGARLAVYGDAQSALASSLESATPPNLAGLNALTVLTDRIAAAPQIGAGPMANAAWIGRKGDIAALIDLGLKLRSIEERLGGRVTGEAWEADLAEVNAALALLPVEFDRSAFVCVGELADLLPDFITEVSALARSVGRDAPSNLHDAQVLARIGAKVASAPDASAEAFASDLWDEGVERAGDLANAVATYEASRALIGTALTEAAWSMDLAESRTVLASHGNGFFKIFSGEWRRHSRLVRSVATRTGASLDETLGMLDALAQAQAARRIIDEERDFGLRAFGADWRGDKSSSGPLIALVEWMRSLRGLGAEPRLIASRSPQKSEVGLRAERVAGIVERLAPPAAKLWDALGKARNYGFGGAEDPGAADAVALHDFASRIHRADRSSAALFSSVPDTLDERRGLLETLASGQLAAALLAQSAPFGEAVFGEVWYGPGSDWLEISKISAWMSSNEDIRMLVSRIEDREALKDFAARLLEDRDGIAADLDGLFDYLTLDRQASLGSGEAREVAIHALAERLKLWSISEEKLFQWVGYRDRAEKANVLGCGDIVKRLADGRLAPDAAISGFEMAYYESVYSQQVRSAPELGTFDGTLHGRLAREFAEMDRQRIASASFEVVRAHHGLVPPRDGGAVGPLGTLRSEIVKRRGHMPIRKLMEKAAPAVQALKPVFMMSPLSVAQFLAPGVFDFDLLVMDEASQIQPVDALGAVARAKQVVVVGDPKQLPPTAFFSKMTGAANDEDEDGRVADIESILGLFTARGLPMRMLRWHYRSKHQSLIAVSNRQFYENKLFIVPSPYTAEAGMGLRFHHIPQGVWDAGATRTNAVEAKIVAQAIIAHATENPNLSLGVATFSTSQRRAILDQLELLRRALPQEVETFFQAHPSEPFFIKNLENVQGDERDVIFISVGYGPTTPGGRVPMRFGPLGTEGGERRLNVLISRAKQRCEVFSSMTDEDIEPEFAASRKGVFAFRMFMHFARTGRMTLAESTGRDHDSVFEEQVSKALQARGYQVHRQVGLAGFYIDLAVADPDRPGRYLLGIECDGASYHDARSARDRDRLRQSVLESHGWNIHRIWSTDWFQRPNEQLELVVARVEAAKVEFDAELEGRRRKRAVPVDIVAVERGDVTEIGFVANDDENQTIAYEEANPQRPAHLTCDLHDAPRGALSALVEEVVAKEGPVHIDEVVNRIRAGWGLKRAGGRIQEAIERAAEHAVGLGRLSDEDHFLSVPGREPKVRDRSQVTASSIRRVDALPPTEIAAAVLSVVRSNFGATDEQVSTVVSRALGFKSTSAQLRDLILQVTQGAIDKDWLARKDGMLVIGSAAPVKSAERKPSPLETLVAAGEGERLEFKETLRWDVIQERENKKLEDVVIKTLAGFANRVGGTLLIGVSDDGEAKGLDRDYGLLGGNRDKFELHLTNLFAKHFGQACRASKIRVSFPQHQGVVICRVDMDRSSQAVYVSVADRMGNVAERFFVRSGNSTQELTVSESHIYVREHFQN